MIVGEPGLWGEGGLVFRVDGDGRGQEIAA